MIAIPNYQIFDKLYESANTLVYRANRNKDNLPVILKILKEDYPTPGKLSAYRQEHRITSQLKIEGVIKTFGIEKYQNTLVIILEDVGASSLKILKSLGKCIHNSGNLKSFLNIAIKIATTLGEIHSAHVIHKDINPSNIILNPETGQLKIIDFGISTLLSREKSVIKKPEFMEGTLAYISPEQTGRMNRSLDYRTDFYSLGITFYEILTGHLPFESSDALELVHCHIAKQPIPPHKICPDMPKVLSDIIMRLMSKTPEERYQSIFGLNADLHSCLEQLNSAGAISYFPICQKDFSGVFQIPEKLYGREKEVETLMQAFERASINRTELMLIAGYSGVGKSSLINEVHKPITEKKGYFIAGKFAQFQRNIPYSGFIQAFKEFVNLLLTCNEEELAKWKETILNAVGNNGKVLTDAIPNLELLIGQQPDISELGPVEAQNRFNYVFKNFVKAAAQKDHPLVIVIDDLQWSDLASLNLLKTLINDQESQHLLIIGAYRDNEVTPSHPFIMALEEIKNEKIIINTITLPNLSLKHIISMLFDTIHCSEIVEEFANLIFEKTEGNPFFVRRLLISLYDDGVLKFDFEKQSWHFELSAIENLGITDNVLDLMEKNIQKLPEETQKALRSASCIGDTFLLGILAYITGRCNADTFSLLQIAVEEGLIIPIEVNYKSISASKNSDEAEFDENKGETETNFRFVHDRIHQAAYSLLNDEERKTTHLCTGRLLLTKAFKPLNSEQLFEVVKQLNAGRDGITEKDERTTLAELNLQAGIAAFNGAAYNSSFMFFQTGIELIDQHSWNTHYQLKLQLYTKITEAAYLTADYESMEKCGDIVLNNAQELIDKIDIYKTKIAAYQAQLRLPDSLTTCLYALKLLGVEIPEPAEVTTSDIEGALTRAKQAMEQRRVEDFKFLPEMTDDRILQALMIMSGSLSVIYKAAPMLTPIIFCKMMELTVTYGRSPFSPIAFGCYGLILCATDTDIEQGYALGKLSINLLEQYKNKKDHTVVLELSSWSTAQWKEHIRDTLDVCFATYQIGVENGNFEYAGYGLAAYTRNLLFIGENLEKAEQTTRSNIEKLRQIKQGLPINWVSTIGQVFINLHQSDSDDPTELKGEMCDENKLLQISRDIGDMIGSFYLNFCKTFLYYLFKQNSQALEFTLKTREYIAGMAGTVDVGVFCFYDSLIHLAEYRNMLEQEQKEVLDNVCSNQARLKNWSDHAPMNFLHKYYLVEAEYCRVVGKYGDAREYYDLAIAFAKEHDYINEEALANELAGEFCLQRGLSQHARTYLRQAHYSYQVWGATAKVLHLEEQYPQWLGKIKNLTDLSLKTCTLMESWSDDYLDLAAVIKASQAISQEMELDKLLSKMMAIVIENGCAESGLFIHKEEGQWRIEAARHVDGELLVFSEQLSKDKEYLFSNNNEQHDKASNLFPESIVNYVIRTYEIIVLTNAIKEEKFSKDQYIQKKQPKSVLCMPLINQGRLGGIIYLENNLTTGAFTSERVEVVRLLASQAAISIENARLYTKLRESEEKYRVLFHNFPLGIIVTDKSGLIVETNSMAEQILNIPRKELEQRLIGEKDCKLIRPDGTVLSQNEYVSVRALHSKEVIKDVEVGVVKSNKDTIWLNITAAPIPLKDYGVITAYSDITKRKSVEKELTLHREHLEDLVQKRTEELTIARDQAESANRAKSVFLANISHELRTPLNAIMGFSRIMHFDSNITKEQQSNLSIINRSGDHLLHLINDVLTMSKIEAERATLHISNFDLVRLLTDIKDMFLLKAREKRIQLYFEIPLSLPKYISTDEVKLKQVLINLINNAIKFTDKGYVLVNVSANSTELSFEIKDTGKGIVQEEQKKLFEPFFQTSSGRKEYEGSGLGLSISRKFVQMMGGDIQVASSGVPGFGSVFSFSINMSIIEPSCIPEVIFTRSYKRAVRLENNQQVYRILVVDDHESGRRLLSKVLTSVDFSLSNFDIQEARNGIEAVESWEKWNPHLILMDIEMPIMDGLEATRIINYRMRENTTEIQTIIIGLSNSNFQEYNEKLIEAGCKNFLCKPIHENQIFEFMEQYLDIRFVYEDIIGKDNSEAVEDLSIEDISSLPSDWLDNFKNAIDNSDATYANELLQNLSGSDTHVKKNMKILIDSYRFDILLNLLEEIKL